MYICIYIKSFFPFCSALPWCCSETAASQSRRDGRLQERAGSGAEAREREEDCLRWVDFRARVSPDTSTPPQPPGLQFSVSIGKQNNLAGQGGT